MLRSPLTPLIFVCSCFLAVAVPAARAETIHLKSGETIEGTITSRTDELIKVDTGIGFDITYYMEDIASIDGETLNQPAPASVTAPLQTPESQVVPTAPAPTPAPVAAPAPPPPAARPPAAPKPAAKTSEDENAPVSHLGVTHFKSANLIEQALEKPKPAPKKIAGIPAKPLSKEAYLKEQLQRQHQLEIQRLQSIVHKLDAALSAAFKDWAAAHPEASGSAIVPLVFLGILIAIYVLACLPLMLIARKLGHSQVAAWIPIVQIFLLVRMSRKSLWWIVLLLVPVLNIIVMAVIWMGISRELHQTPLLGLLMLIPGLNYVVLWYFALCKLPPPVLEEPPNDQLHLDEAKIP